MDSPASYNNQSRSVGLAMEYLRLFGFPTIAWVLGSALLAALPFWRLGDLRAFAGALSLAVLAVALGLLLSKYAKLHQTIVLATSLVLSLLSIGLIRLGLIETRFLLLLCYTLLFLSSTSIIIAMFPADRSNPESFDEPRGEPSPLSPQEAVVSEGGESTTDIAQHGIANLPAKTLAADAIYQPVKSSFAWSWVGLALAMALSVYMVVVPAISMFFSSFTPKPTSKVLTEMTFSEYIRLHTVSGVVMLLFLATGASIGSFLNVVIYRLPRGLRLLWPPSACPNCGYKIKGWDNLPILAWIGLKGRCRQCHVSISSRYPIIELTVAAVFVALYYLELLSGGGSLPIREPNTYKGVVWVLLYTKWDLVSIYLLHTLMLTVLLAWGMINFDRFRVPKLAGVLVVVLASVCMMLVPHLNPTNKALPESLVTGPIANCVAGLLVGVIGGCFLQLIFPNAAQSVEASQPITTQVDDPIVEPTVATQSAESELQIANQAIDSASPITTESEIETTVESNPEVYSSQSKPIHEVTHGPMDLYGTVSSRPQVVSDALLSMLLIGSILGPSAVLNITLVSAILGWVWALALRLGIALPRAPITLLLFGVAAIFVAFWRQSCGLPLAWWPKPDSNLWLTLTWISLLLIATITSFVVQKTPRHSDAAAI